MGKKELLSQIEYLEEYKNQLKQEVIELDDEKLFQSFGVYKPQYNFANLEEYKNKLSTIRKQQKDMIKCKTAAFCLREKWYVDGSEEKGKKFIATSIKQILYYFNIECDSIIDKVKFSNYKSSQQRIYSICEKQNKFFATSEIAISRKYLILKLDELALSYEYQLKKQEERDYQRELREQQREEARIAKELEEKRIELEKEKAHYQNAKDKLTLQIQNEKDEIKKEFLLERENQINAHIDNVSSALKEVDYRQANYKAGYVYIISNIGAFGENIYKIGMTRRLEPEDRINELSGASVPFRFDIHALIFTDDAPKLESALHSAFADKKLNLINGRKEFFNVSLDEIKKVVYENYDKTIDWIDIPDAQQYRETQMLRKQINNND